MGVVDSIGREWRKYQESQYKYGDLASLTPADYDSFEKSTEAKPSKRVINSREDILAFAKAQNWVRLKRLKKDYAWLQLQCKKLGLNPDEARWLL